MKKRPLSMITLILTLALLVGCKAAPTETPAAEKPDATLTVKSSDQSVTLTWDDIQEMPAYEGMGGLISSVGEVTPPSKFKGVTLEDLCGLVGGITEENSVSAIASDGYAMTFSYDQIVMGDFDTYDPVTGDDAPFDGKLWVVIAYERDGELLSEEADGTFRLAILGSPKVVTDGHWWVKWVETIEVKQALNQWTFHLEGALSEDIDRGTFETGAAPNCHGTSWADDKGRVWTGIPLWLLVGRVDDENVHEDDAFNDGLVEAGYDVNVIAADGYSVTLDSATVARNDDIIVAYLLDDEPLPEKHWPLRLVGPNLESSDWVGGIATIEMVLPE
ncbi:MAG: molybdopterin-dependent oxidoreductase [Chloroflexota bacterium]|nr:molybdopterin-dependent oxidoreductase [Chloroflexota bacterium]